MKTGIKADQPLGVGFGVAVDWGLTVQLAGMVVVAIVSNMPPRVQGNTVPVAMPMMVLGEGIGAVLFAVLGEGVRAGRQWAWYAQVGIMAVLSLYGLVSLPGTFAALTHGHYLPLVPQVILIIIAPLILYRMIQPQTRRWYASVAPTVARARHGSFQWLAVIGAFALVGGVLMVIEIFT